MSRKDAKHAKKTKRGDKETFFLCLSKKKPKFKFPEMTRLWTTFPQLSGDSTQFIEEDRG